MVFGFGEGEFAEGIGRTHNAFDVVHHIGEAGVIDFVPVVGGAVVVFVLAGEEVEDGNVGQIEGGVVRGTYAGDFTFEGEAGGVLFVEESVP